MLLCAGAALFVLIVWLVSAAGDKLLRLPYAGIEDKTLLLVPQVTHWVFLSAVPVWCAVLAGYMLLSGDRSLRRRYPNLQSDAPKLFAAGAVAIVVVFGLSRFDYWAITPDHILVQRPWGKTEYSFSQVASISTACFMTGRKNSREEGRYTLSVGGRKLDLLRDNKPEQSVSVIEWLQPRLLAHDYIAADLYYGDARCLHDISTRLGGNGFQRLAAIGISVAPDIQ